MNWKFSLVAAMLASNSLLLATEPAPSETKIVMDRVHESFIKIIPYIYSEKKLSELKAKNNSDQKEEVIRTLNNISDFFKTAKNVDKLQSPGFRPSLDTINAHMNETILSVKNDHTSYASKRLKSMSAICISCHTQLSGYKDFAQNIPEASKALFQRPFDYANYLMLLRRFPEATQSYEQSLQENLKNPSSDQAGEEMGQALKRLLSIHTKIEFNQEKALAFVQSYKSNKQLPKIAQDNLKQWEKSLKKWKGFDLKNVKSISAFIKTHLTPLENERAETAMGEHDVTLLIASGVLTKYISENNNTRLAPQILYWLAVAEKRLGSSYLFSLGDLYLKECIQLYPKSSYAKKCYKEYEDNITFGYSGSSGTDIPEDEKQELSRLKALLK